MPTFTDEQLVAYADGELPAGEAEVIAAAAARDDVLAQRIARFTESRRILHETFAQQLTAPVPQRLLDAIQGGARGRGWRRRLRTEWLPLAAAASLALAVGLAGGRWWSGAPSPAVVGLTADAAALTRTLETHASGEPLRTAQFEIVPTASLRAASGAYCREFESAVFGADQTARARGLACRDDGGAWRTVAAVNVWAAPDAPEPESYVPAGGAALNLTTLLGVVEPLTPQQEQALIGHHWRAPQ